MKIEDVINTVLTKYRLISEAILSFKDDFTINDLYNLIDLVSKEHNIEITNADTNKVLDDLLKNGTVKCEKTTDGITTFKVAVPTR